MTRLMRFAHLREKAISPEIEFRIRRGIFNEVILTSVNNYRNPSETVLYFFQLRVYVYALNLALKK